MRGPPPGTPKTPGSGRKKGTPNKVTVQTREALWQAYIRLEDGDEANPVRLAGHYHASPRPMSIVVSCAPLSPR